MEFETKQGFKDKHWARATVSPNLADSEYETEREEPKLLFVKIFFSVHVVQLWNKLPEEVVSDSSVSALF